MKIAIYIVLFSAICLSIMSMEVQDQEALERTFQEKVALKFEAFKQKNNKSFNAEQEKKKEKKISKKI